MESQSQRPRTSSACSPEFEFWMVRNPSSTPPDLLTADELFVDGFLLPLHLLSLHPSPNLPPADPPPNSILAPASSSPAPASGSRRWIDIFRSVGDKKPEEKEKEKETRDRRSNGSGSGSRSGSGDLHFNLNIWPFSRSHSAGNTAGNSSGRTRPIATRKVSSAPCSRSNSRGETSVGGRKWTSSPARAGVHLGRSSPVWKLRRTGMGTKDMTRNSSTAGGGVRLINLNVNSCIGYQNQVTCRDDDSDGVTAGGASTAGGSSFSFRALFSKKVY